MRRDRRSARSRRSGRSAAASDDALRRATGPACRRPRAARGRRSVAPRRARARGRSRFRAYLAGSHNAEYASSAAKLLHRGTNDDGRNQTLRKPRGCGTSFVVEALIVSQPLHAAAVNFLVRLATEDVRIRFSSMLELELAETAFQIALKENHPRDWKRFRHDGRARRRASPS